MTENSLFDMYSDVFGTLLFEPSLISNDKDKETLELLRAERETGLSRFACRTSETRGRVHPEQPCNIRSCYERDMGRIIFSQSFRRLRHKTQVFFNPSNDHICSRIEHVIYVNYISTIIGRALNLNIDLIQAIAMGHDIGHAPFGHTGEKVISKCMQDIDKDLFFEHEKQSLRVLDVLEEHREGEYGLNLTFEVRDGIVSHCGETYDERTLSPRRDKTFDMVSSKTKKDGMAPATLEGCVVRFADKIAYVGRDVEDAFRAGIVSGYDSMPKEVIERLGSSNAETINVLVGDIIHSSLDSDMISISEGNFQAMNEFLYGNVEKIYRAKKISTYEKTVKLVVEGLFEAFYECCSDIEKAMASENDMIRKFAKFCMKHPEKDCPDAVKVADYISGMTDNFANTCFDSIYRV